MKNILRRFYLFGVIIALVLSAGTFLQFIYYNQRLEQEMENSIVLSRSSVVANIEHELKTYAQVISSIADYMYGNDKSEEELLKYYKGIMAKYPLFYTVYYGNVNNEMINGSGWVAPEDFDLRKRPWYIKAAREQKLVFTEAFVNATQDMLVITIAEPIYNAQHELEGVVAGDVSMQEIINLVKDKKIRGMGYSFLIDGKGNILAHPGFTYDYTSRLNNIDEIIEESENYLTNGKTETVTAVLDGVKGYLTYEPIDETDWMLGSFIPYVEYMNINNQIIMMFVIVFISSLAGYIFMFLLQKRFFIEPVVCLENDIQKIDISDSIDYRIAIEKNDPLVNLKNNINVVLDKTQEFFYRLKSEEEEMSSMNEELTASMEQLAAADEDLRLYNSELIESHRLLTESQKRNSEILKAMPDLLFIVSNEGRFIDCLVDEDSRLLFPKESFIGKSIIEILPEEIAVKAMEMLRLTLENKELTSFEYKMGRGEELEYYELRMIKSTETEVLAISRDVTARKKMEDRLEYLSYRDQLTGLYNRRYFDKVTAREDIKEKLPLSVIMADVNGLKIVNDSFGHAAGDELLVKMTNVLKKGCRSGDIIFRIGGDEFLILLPMTDINETEGIIKCIKDMATHEKAGSLELSISFGWETKYSEKQSIQEVIKKAEDNMYKTKLFESPGMRGKALKTIINALYEKNKREEQHSHRVSDLSALLGEALGLYEREVQELRTIGLLHDIGKIAIDESILNKEGKLSDDEWIEMKRHPEIGYRILSTVNEMAEIGEYVLAHHERWDGKGYPKGLKDYEIPLQSRIISVVDAYDAMTSERTYRKPMSNEIAATELRMNAGKQFDPEIVEIFVNKVLCMNI